MWWTYDASILSDSFRRPTEEERDYVHADCSYLVYLALYTIVFSRRVADATHAWLCARIVLPCKFADNAHAQLCARLCSHAGVLTSRIFGARGLRLIRDQCLSQLLLLAQPLNGDSASRKLLLRDGSCDFGRRLGSRVGRHSPSCVLCVSTITRHACLREFDAAQMCTLFVRRA